MLLINDETHTICAGPGGATAAWGLDPDIVVMGKPIGGGIPVARDEAGKLYGVDAVIDKDLAACRLAEDLKADVLLILTEVEQVCLNYGKPDQKTLSRLNADEALAYQREGHFAAGSMGPKVEAALRFVAGCPSRRAIITRLDLALEALEGSRGTEIRD